MVNVTLYESPRLLSTVQLGQIIEARPGALVTRKSYADDESNKDPSDVFGYVSGFRDPKKFGVMPYNERVEVRMLLPDHVKDFNCTPLRFYGPRTGGPYSAVGELTDFTTEHDDLYLTGQLSLPEVDQKAVRATLQEFADNRSMFEYYCELPDGTKCSLGDILIKLRPKSRAQAEAAWKAAWEAVAPRFLKR